MRDLTLVSNKTIRERETETDRHRQAESKQPSPAKKSRRAVPFSLHICRYKIKMVMSHESLLFLKKLFRYNEYYWKSPSKQIDSFHYLRRSRTFLWKINNGVVDA